jgi:cytochrome c oxidase subunit 4
MSDTETETDQHGTPAVHGDAPEPHGAAALEHEHPKDSLYVLIAVILAALTAMEVSTYYLDFGPLFLPVLLTLMVVKFVLVVLFFMHLKFDAKIFGRLFWTGLLLAVFVYCAALATFQVFSQ